MRSTHKATRLVAFVGLITLGVVLSVSIAARGAHQFSDVPNFPANIHEAVDWFVNRSITLGCAAGLFCPNDFVTRAQMAIFMQRLGAALTPTILYTWASGSSLLDLDQAPVLCQTGDYVAPFPQTIIIHSRVSVGATGGDLDYWTHGAISFNSGASWAFLSGSASTEARAINGGGHALATSTSSMTLNPGISVRFGAAVERAFGPASGGGGTGDIAKYRCVLDVEIVNRNGTSIPFGSPGQAPQRIRGR